MKGPGSTRPMSVVEATAAELLARAASLEARIRAERAGEQVAA